jgi:hypothetical protein
MEVQITFPDGTMIAPVYDPEHLEDLKVFYSNQAKDFQIRNYIITEMATNKVVALGGRF